MQIARFAHGDNPRYGIVDGDDLVVLKSDPLFDSYETTGERVPLDGARLLSPVIPRSKVVALGRNYADHVKELGNDLPTAPVVFLKPNTSVIGPDDPIVLPEWSQEVHYEAELAVVVGRLCKDVPAERVNDVIFGYTVANDVTARDIQRAEDQWTRAKGFDTSCPLGPWIETDVDVSDLSVRSYVDGEQRQDGRTSQMIMSVHEIVAYASSIFTLLPGDVILTGTPAGIGQIDAGQRVEVEVEGIGRFGNPVVRR
ncbi:2-keto-4-pentenoate hydratase/2-oxohepta-3-ene-1,7-dioic acid hydratase (catechol pathway) [Ruaniaceae bacterium KH17]|nr:2-keto-4-pentenoate hydratase/2-oxohepta-3-ene-1,7-dioic acid hydratase (catechol pathway) [Ruaniaceae bacterium KH17]